MKARKEKWKRKQIVEKREDDLICERVSKEMALVRVRKAVRAESDEKRMEKKQTANCSRRMRVLH